MDRVAAMRPIGRAEVRRRRRDILFTLAGAALITLVLAVLLGGIAIWCNLLADVLLATYVVLLVQVRRMAVERQTKVRYLAPRTAPEPATLLVRRRA
jgi:small-conductance mechanosensitive channel